MQTSWQEVVQISQQYRNARVEYWLSETLFNFSWWILLVTTLGLFVIWVILLDKKRVFEILSYGFLVTTISSILDIIGIYLMLWRYNHTLTPFSIPIEIHIIQMPIIYMIIYQYFNPWKTFLLAIIINAFFFAFILEPLLVWLQVYELYNWKHSYSFIPYILLGVLIKWVIHKLKQNNYA
ncbi:CBO0543 family protein [Ureibacillus aquaedulcis]|uniref:CBO0543 family protein n=1 Tax=Ureibacillus aquaedulcis TaxID=3058421 RepID=A0ABT8GTG8_9BACL|nr:CBO0543 family protein [Ureibacillus sp. BA0131]MDN4494709.1 CBO0543 family protein [Ureibacillus sp. BA0131]